ncbi:hypothetical protein [uncultured Rhodospira sp.]|uniref:hypothetical protein n=1 Tax=uncultured Rhodospira sp. TaxID=1936189 RepID=UPI002618B284|nr:hypothetical protein [uncultured Rhodospira sp.]
MPGTSVSAAGQATALRLIVSLALALWLGPAQAQAQQELVGAWQGQGMDPSSGALIGMEYLFNPDGTFQKSLGLQVGPSSGYTWIAGVWFTEGQWLRLEVREHYDTHQGNRGPQPPGELWVWRLLEPATLQLTHSLCVQQQIDRPDCVLILQRIR